MARNNGLTGNTVTYNIDNFNALQALIKKSGNPIEIHALAALIWHRVSDVGITQRFERVPSKRNFAGRPTRNVKIEYTSVRRGRFASHRKMRDLTKQEIKNIILGAPLGSPL